MMKQVRIFLIYCLLLAACIQKTPQPSVLPATSSSPAAQAPSPTPKDLFEVQAWVDDPAPAREAQVTLYGSLIKNGVHLGGIMMQAMWPDDEKEPGEPDCFVLVTYGRGVCVFNASSFPPGEPVPVRVELDYEGKTYTGQTSFTPR